MKKHISHRVLSAAAVVAWLGLPPAHPADRAADGGILTLQLENDLVANSDGQFSHGSRIAWMAPESHVPGWANALADMMPRDTAVRGNRIVYSLEQSIFTPDDITIRELVPDDRPYAGWLNIGLGLVSVGDDFLDNLELGIGVVGPASFAEDTQTTWHEWFGFRRPEGWRNQLRNEPTVQLSYERDWRAWGTFSFDRLGGDITPHMGVALGNAVTQAAVGLMVQVGQDLRNDYGPPRIRPSQPGSDYFVNHGGFGWYLFAGLEGRLVARNIFLDGNTFRDSHSVDKKHVVADFQAGIAFFLGRMRIAYTHVLRTKEFLSQDAPQQFGSISASITF